MTQLENSHQPSRLTLRSAACGGKSAKAVALAASWRHCLRPVRRDRASVRRRDAPDRRPSSRGSAAWRTLESPLEPRDVARDQPGCADVIVIDCITLGQQHSLTFADEEDAETRSKLLGRVRRTTGQHWIIVTNEVGLGIAPQRRSGAGRTRRAAPTSCSPPPRTTSHHGGGIELPLKQGSSFHA